MWLKALYQPRPATVNWLLRKRRVRTDVEEDRRQILALIEPEFVRPSLESSFYRCSLSLGGAKAQA